MIGSTLRQQAVSSVIARSSARPSETNGISVDKLYGSSVFSLAVMKSHLPKDVFRSVKRTIETGAQLDPAVADVVASAMKE